jgi:hypothetical protein
LAPSGVAEIHDFWTGTSYIPFPPAAGFAFGKSVNSIGVATNVAKFGNMAEDISGRIQNIQLDVFLQP